MYYDVVFRRVSIGSALIGSAADVPVNVTSLLKDQLKAFNMTPQSQQKLETVLRGRDGHVDPRELAQAIMQLESRFQCSKRDKLDDLASNITQFVDEGCPICCVNNIDLKMYPCCGFCVCDGCFSRMMGSRRNCPHCRTPVTPSDAIRDATPVVVDVEEENDGDDVDYPRAPTFDRVGGTNHLGNLLREYTGLAKSQSANLTRVLQILVHLQYKRLFIFVDKGFHSMRETNVSRLAIATGLEIDEVKGVSGKGTGFAKYKKTFDTHSPHPMAILTSSKDLLIGANFDYVDAMITVGRIGKQERTQARGRVFRPRESRDNTRGIPMIKIVCG